MSNRRSTIDDRRSALIVSNGFGEDAVGNALAKELRPHIRVTAYPLVGVGQAYEGVPVLEPRRVLPSGGFALRGSWKGLWQDLRTKGFRLWLDQRRALRNQRGKHDLVIAIGDVYCLRMAALAGAGLILVATAKSVYNEPHRWFERLLMKRLAQVVFARDQPTAEKLAAAGISARYAGNPLMDTLAFTGEPLPINQSRPTVTLLPGSRADAYVNVVPLLSLCAQIAQRTTANFLCTLAPTIDEERVRQTAAALHAPSEAPARRRSGCTIYLAGRRRIGVDTT